jgi:rubredoxin
MKCSLCGFIFKEKDAESGCTGCVLVKKCDLVKCPNCGFEMAPEPSWAKMIKDRRN